MGRRGNLGLEHGRKYLGDAGKLTLEVKPRLRAPGPEASGIPGGNQTKLICVPQVRWLLPTGDMSLAGK